jgi:hypothetical protein
MLRFHKMHNWTQTVVTQLAVTACLVTLLAGCSTLDLAPTNTPAIALKEPQTRKIIVGLLTPGTVSFPACKYEPAFQNKDGIYYLCDKRLIQKALGIDEAKPGGIFLPHASATDKRHGYWIDETDRFNLLSTASNHRSRVYRFAEPLQCEIVPTQASK